MPQLHGHRDEGGYPLDTPTQIFDCSLDKTQLRDIIESLPEAVSYYDNYERLVLFNSKTLKCLPALADKYTEGTKLEEILRAGVERGVFLVEAGTDEDWIQQLLAYHRNPEGHIEQVTGDNRKFRIVKQRTAAGGVVGIWSDVTEIRNIDQTLEDSFDKVNAYLSELNASKAAIERQAAELAALAENEALLNKRLQYEIEVKNKLFSIIAHDLRSPFNSLLGMTQMMSQLADSLSKEKLVTYANGVNEAGTQVFTLLQNLLDWSRLQMEGVTSEPEIIPLRDVAQEVVNLFKATALEKDIELNVTMPTTPAYAQQYMVQTVLRNLLSNAIKFTPSGGWVALTLHRAGDMVEVTVSDTGVGMPPERAAEIFKLTQSQTTAGTAGEQGTGLGLPLCKDMVERNGGRIWMVSQPGAGSQVHFTLPAQAGR